MSGRRGRIGVSRGGGRGTFEGSVRVNEGRGGHASDTDQSGSSSSGSASSGGCHGAKKNVRTTKTVDEKEAKYPSSREASPQPSTSKGKVAKPARQRAAFPIQELIRMMALNVDKSDVKQFKLIPQNVVSEWMVKRVVSPHEFYLEFKFDETIGGGALAERNYHRWWPRMQEFYNDPVNQLALKMEVGDIYVGRCFAFEGPDPNNANQVMWHRVRVFRILPAEKMALVFLCDMGKLVTADMTKLLKLTPDYAQYPAHLFRCYLYHLIPATGSLNWTVEATAFFKDVMSRLEGTRITGVVLARSGAEVQRCMPEVFHNMGVVIFGDTMKQRCSVNALMVKSGHAVATGLFACCPHQLGRSDVLEGIKFKEETKLPQKRLPPPPEILVIKPTDKLYDDKYKRAVELYAAITRPEMTWLPQDYKDRLTGNDLQVCWLPSTVQERIGHVKIQNCKGPNNIIFRMAKDSQTLSDMQNAIEIKLRQARPLRVIKPGMFIAFPTVTPDPEKSKKNPITWLRGMILFQTDLEDLFKILALDYGTEFMVHRDEAFELQKPFSEIPSFAIRAHLAVPGLFPANDGDKWSDRAKQYFVRYLMAWDESGPIYYAYPPFGSEVIQLDSLNQEVVFDTESKKWVAAAANGLKTFSFETRSHPLVESLFRSLGVQIKYEVMNPDSSVWHFMDLHDELLSKGEAEPKMKTRSDTRIHVDILDELEISVLQQAIRFYEI